MKEQQFIISEEHPAIAGHFPGHPVVPGVLLMSRALSKLSLSAPFYLKKVRFLKMVFPDDTVVATLNERKAGQYRLQLEVAEQPVLSANIIEGESELIALAHPAPANQMINKVTIDQRIPHSGSMCLLDKALYWDDNSMLAEATSHHQQDNPLLEPQAEGAILSALVIPEYVSQVIALHGATLADEQKKQCEAPPEKPREGYLAIIPKSVFYCTSLHNVTAPLRIYIRILLKQENACFYQFSVMAQQQLLAEGEVGIVLEKG